MSIFEQFMRGRQLAQEQALNQMKLAQSQQLFPLEQQLKQLELDRAQSLAPIELEKAQVELEGQKDLLEKGLLGYTAGQREFLDLTQGMSQEDITQARRIKLGLDPRAVGSAIMTTLNQGIVKEVAATEGEIAGAKEEAKLLSQLELKPEIEDKVTRVVASAKADADAIQDAKDNNSAFNLYQTAFGGLSASLGQTSTGPLYGLLPALTSEQQIADGAIAAVAPILKQMFRAAGEGTFTDSDQKILMDMIPTRKDLPEARAAKVSNIDSIVRAKLKQPLVNNFEQPQQEGQLMTDANGNKAIVYPDGTFKEVQ